MLDLAAEAQRLRLDTLAVQVSAELTRAGIPHALLKGPTTALWLYDPPRTYRDVDILVAPDRVPEVVAALTAAGIAYAGAGVAGEEAPHSMLLISAEGFEVDIHQSLPTVPLGPVTAWDVLGGHLSELDLQIGRVPALDEAGRCLMLALHALNSGPHSGQPIEDLRRARKKADTVFWQEATRLAQELGVADLYGAGIAMLDPTSTESPSESARARLYRAGASSGAFGLERLFQSSIRGLPKAVFREVVPTAGFMRRSEQSRVRGPGSLVWAYVRRWGRLSRQFPTALRDWRSAQHRNSRV